MIKFNNQNKIFSYYFFLILFLLLTNQYFNYYESLIFGGADGESYINISKSFPGLPEKNIPPIHSERFLFYYILGFISKLLNIDIYNLYRFFVFTFLALINFFLILLFKKKKINLSLILILLSLINLNPYISRFYIAVPSLLNDLIFIFGLTLFLYSIEVNKTKILITSLIILFFSRQTSIAIVLALILTKFIYKKKFFFQNIKIVLIVLLFILVYFVNYQYSSNTFDFEGLRLEQYAPDMRLFGLFLQDNTFKQKLIFLTLPFLSFLPLFLFFLIFRKAKKIKFILPTDPKNFLYFLICLLIIFQPILSGVSVTGKNIIRLTTLSYILILFLLFNFTEEKKITNYFIIVFFSLFIILWSLHPTFSNINIFKPLAKKIEKIF